MNKYNIQGFPSIILSKNGGEIKHFESTPDKETLEKFVNDMLI